MKTMNELNKRYFDNLWYFDVWVAFNKHELPVDYLAQCDIAVNQIDNLKYEFPEFRVTRLSRISFIRDSVDVKFSMNAHTINVMDDPTHQCYTFA